MDRPSKMDIADWQDSPLPVVVKKRPPRRFLPPTLIGILGTLLVHALFIQSVPFGSRGPKAKPPEIQESADALSKSKTDSAESLVLISLPTMAVSNQPAAQHLVSSLHDLTIMKIQSPVDIDPPALVNIEALALSEDPASRPISNSGDSAEQARLFGIYTGQIQARIDRVWRRPRAPINESAAGKEPTNADQSFQCEAQIVQDARGNVQEILLPRCNGSAAWQRSLVSAIQQASPLPAPPSPKVFTQSIALNFVGLPYVQGASNEEYEIVPLARVDQ
jgi:TonB C terminal